MYHEAHILCFNLCAELGFECFCYICQTEWCEVYLFLTTIQAEETQKTVKLRCHTFCSLFDVSHILLLNLFISFLFKQTCISDNGRQRNTQFVRNGVHHLLTGIQQLFIFGKHLFLLAYKIFVFLLFFLYLTGIFSDNKNLSNNDKQHQCSCYGYRIKSSFTSRSNYSLTFQQILLYCGVHLTNYFF